MKFLKFHFISISRTRLLALCSESSWSPREIVQAEKRVRIVDRGVSIIDKRNDTAFLRFDETLIRFPITMKLFTIDAHPSNGSNRPRENVPEIRGYSCGYAIYKSRLHRVKPNEDRCQQAGENVIISLHERLSSCRGFTSRDLRFCRWKLLAYACGASIDQARSGAR